MARWMDTLDVYEGHFYEVETRCGTQFVPGDLVGRNATPDDLADYLEGGAAGVEPEDVTLHDGTAVLWRFTEPGYMDCTEWRMAASAEDAERDAAEENSELDADEDSEEE